MRLPKKSSAGYVNKTAILCHMIHGTEFKHFELLSVPGDPDTHVEKRSVTFPDNHRRHKKHGGQNNQEENGKKNIDRSLENTQLQLQRHIVQKIDRGRELVQSLRSPNQHVINIREHIYFDPMRIAETDNPLFCLSLQIPEKTVVKIGHNLLNLLCAPVHGIHGTADVIHIRPSAESGKNLIHILRSADKDKLLCRKKPPVDRIGQITDKKRSSDLKSCKRQHWHDRHQPVAHQAQLKICDQIHQNHRKGLTQKITGWLMLSHLVSLKSMQKHIQKNDINSDHQNMPLTVQL